MDLVIKENIFAFEHLKVLAKYETTHCKLIIIIKPMSVTYSRMKTDKWTVHTKASGVGQLGYSVSDSNSISREFEPI